MSKSKSTQTQEKRYYVVSRNGYLFRGTKTDGYATFKGAQNARARADERILNEIGDIIPSHIRLLSASDFA